MKAGDPSRGGCPPAVIESAGTSGRGRADKGGRGLAVACMVAVSVISVGSKTSVLEAVGDGVTVARSERVPESESLGLKVSDKVKVSVISSVRVGITLGVMVTVVMVFVGVLVSEGVPVND